jgi:hypothetical protein
VYAVRINDVIQASYGLSRFQNMGENGSGYTDMREKFGFTSLPSTVLQLKI